jgi:hypothetical protein
MSDTSPTITKYTVDANPQAPNRKNIFCRWVFLNPIKYITKTINSGGNNQTLSSRVKAAAEKDRPNPNAQYRFLIESSFLLMNKPRAQDITRMHNDVYTPSRTTRVNTLVS